MEITDITEGLKLYDDNEVKIKDNPLKDNAGYDIPKKKIFFDDVGNVVESAEEKEKKRTQIRAD